MKNERRWMAPNNQTPSCCNNPFERNGYSTKTRYYQDSCPSRLDQRINNYAILQSQPILSTAKTHKVYVGSNQIPFLHLYPFQDVDFCSGESWQLLFAVFARTFGFKNKLYGVNTEIRFLSIECRSWLVGHHKNFKLNRSFITLFLLCKCISFLFQIVFFDNFVFLD